MDDNVTESAVEPYAISAALGLVLVPVAIIGLFFAPNPHKKVMEEKERENEKWRKEFMERHKP